MAEVKSSSSADAISMSKSKIEETLKKYWELGMTDLSSQEGKRLAQLALKENEWISRKQLKTWIGNYKRKLSGKVQVKVKPSHVNAKTRKRSAKDFFQEEFLRDNKGNMSGIGPKWKEIKEDPDQLGHYQAMADQINSDGFVLTEKEKELKALKIQKNMQAEAAELQKLGFECFGMIAKPNSNLIGEFGSGKGKKFLDNHKLCWEFASAINVSETERNKDQWENLRQAVQDKLNVAYHDSLGKSHVEWKRIKAGEVVVDGFPEGSKPSPACTFGVEKLKKILQEDVIITFKDITKSEETTEQEQISFQIIESNTTSQPEIARLVPTDSTSAEDNNTILKTTFEDNQPLEEGLYKVDHILAKKMIRKTTHYLVKWTGYPEPTWEPYTNIDVQIRKNYNSKIKNDL